MERKSLLEIIESLKIYISQKVNNYKKITNEILAEK